MEFKEIVGIDISKKTLDVHIHKQELHKKYDNTPKAIKKMMEWVFSKAEAARDETLFVFEHTGMYTIQLMAALSENDVKFSVVSALEIKRSMGIVRNKSDKADAAMIALYGYRLREEIKLTEMPSEDLRALKHLLGLRDAMVSDRAGYKCRLGEQKRVLKKKGNKVLFDAQDQMINHLSKKIDKVEKEIDAIVKDNKIVNDLYALITSIIGVGPVTALYVIVFTQAFNKFDTWRQFASYTGIAPFKNSSGTSLKGKTKVSHLANKDIKSLLDQCAKTALQHNPEMKKYYERRIAEGKNKMSTVNIIRNKIVARIFAVVQRGTPYVNTLKYAG